MLERQCLQGQRPKPRVLTFVCMKEYQMIDKNKDSLSQKKIKLVPSFQNLLVHHFTIVIQKVQGKRNSRCVKNIPHKLPLLINEKCNLWLTVTKYTIFRFLC